MNTTTKLQAVEGGLSITKPDDFDISMFETKRPDSIAGVSTLQTALPCHSIAQAKDFVRVHSDPEYASGELCFVNVPTPGAARDTMHLIVEDLAVAYLPSAIIQRRRVVLAALPGDRFFLCEVPTRNLDNAYNRDAVAAVERAKTTWIRAASRRDQGVDGYEVTYAQDPDAFPGPVWPRQTLNELIKATFMGQLITDADHAGLKRLVGAKQSVT